MPFEDFSATIGEERASDGYLVHTALQKFVEKRTGFLARVCRDKSYVHCGAPWLFTRTIGLLS